MAWVWENLPALAPGQSHLWWFGWGNYNGVWVTNAVPAKQGRTLQVTSGTVSREPDGSYRYWVTVTNVGSTFSPLYSLHGGQAG